MRLDFIPLDKLSVGKTNMRHGRKSPDVSDILPTVRRRGVLQSLIVRPQPRPDPDDGTLRFEIVAGSRRYHAARIVAGERAASGEGEPPDMLPCAILDDGDDADAIEASMIENMARLDTDEVTQWETFTRLVREGRAIEDISLTFGLLELTVRRVLALGNLLPRIRTLYAKEQIDRVTVRHLTLASKDQQRAWLVLADDPDAHAPTGQQLKAWLFGGQSIAVRHALFDADASGLAIVADLFGEDRWFADPDAFWTAQNAAVEARRAAYIEDGWSDAVIVPPSEHFSSWEYEKTPKRKGGRVFLDVRSTGEVLIHEGYLSRKEAARAGRAEAQPESKPARPEVTSAMQAYLDLHRRAAARAALASHPQAALRLMVAHAIVGSHLFRVTPEVPMLRNDDVLASVAASRGEAVFAEKRAAVLGLLGLDSEARALTGGNCDSTALAALFLRLLDLPDSVVMEVVAIVMGEALASGSASVEAVGLHLDIRMADWWEADAAFFELIRDKEVLAAMVGEVAGERVASANSGEKTKVLKRIVTDHLAGAGGREKVEHWVPRWMAFPPSAYTARDGVGTVRAARALAAARRSGDDPDPAAPSPAMLPGSEERLAA